MAHQVKAPVLPIRAVKPLEAEKIRVAPSQAALSGLPFIRRNQVLQFFG
jgi:hypothetical protein